MLNYRVNINNINKTKVTLPVTSIQFIDFNEIYDYNGINNDKIILTCECEDVDKLKNGSTINTVNTLILNYGTYTFNNEFQVNGVNEDNRSFSIISDKYYTLKPFSIIRNSDIGISEYFEGNTEELKGIILYLNEPHYYDDTYFLERIYTNGIDVKSEEDYDRLPDDQKENYYTDTIQKIPIHFRYTNREGEFKDVIVEFRYFSSDTLIATLSAFEKDKDTSSLYELIFNVAVNETVENDISGNLSGIEILRENFLFTEFTNYYFEYERAVVNVPIPISNSFDTNLYQSDLLQEHFVEEEKRKAINKIVDLEKDVYYPVIKNNNGFSDVYTLRFNLHFREHRGDNWLVDGNSFWNGVKQENGGTIDTQITGDSVSDLLCFLDFNNNDIRYQKNKLKKSFLRLSFYDSTNPANQNMLGYSTIFLDSGNLFSKYARYLETDGYTMIGYDKNNYGIYNIDNKTKKGIRVDREYSFDEEHRLSSQFVLKNKNTSTASSEGFYLYLWKDNESVLPQDLYMKVEFNHAGYGRTIPFMMPYWDKQKWNNKNSGIKTFDEILNDWKSKKYTYQNIEDLDDLITEDKYLQLSPEKRKNYSLLDVFKWKVNKKVNNIETDIETDGHYGMRQYMKFSYIHLKYKYDKDNDKHIYYLDTETYCKIVPVEKWISNKQYHIGDRVFYGGRIWRCKEDNKEAVFNVNYFEEVEKIEEWKANTPYVCGDKVSHEGGIWRCIKDNTDQTVFSNVNFEKLEEECIIDFPKGKDGNEEIVINLYEAKVD